jgi:glycosyltransferase involved in cell wall biosynthesis
MRICRVSRSFPPTVGGLERHVQLLSLHQARHGHEVWVLQPEVEGELESGVRLVRVALGRLSGWICGGRTAAKTATFFFAARAALVARRLHRDKRFDVMHIHGDLIEAAFLGSWARFSRVPVVLTLHAGLNRRPLYRWLASYFFRLIDGFLVVSPTILETLLGLGIDADRVAVISSGVDTSRFRPAAEHERRAARVTLGLSDSEMLVVSVGRLHPMKGYPELIRAAADFGAMKPPRFVIVGDGPDRETLRRQAHDLPNVRFVGNVGHSDVTSFLHAADVFVLPSTDLHGTTEGVPTALIEAMACGLPVVCTNAGGMSHVIQDDRNGLVVPQRDASSLRAALEKLLVSSELRRRFGERNAVLARERDWRIAAAQVTAFYGRVQRQTEVRRLGRRAVS